MASGSAVNAAIAAPGIGGRFVACTRLSRGPKIVQYGGEVQSRNGRTLSFRGIIEGPFTADFHFSTFEEWRDFCNWMAGYIRAISESATALSVMRLWVPASWFDAKGIPTSAIPFGDEGGVQDRTLRVTFEPVDIAAQGSTSKVIGNGSGLAALEGLLFFPNPYMENPSGTDSISDQLYNYPEPAQLVNPLPSSPTPLINPQPVPFIRQY